MMATGKIIFLTTLFYIAGILNAQDIPWEKLRNAYDDPNSESLKDSAIVDNVPLVKPSIPNVSGEYFAIASLLRFFELNGYAKFPFLNSSEFLFPHMQPLFYEFIKDPNKEKIHSLSNQINMYLDSFRKDAVSIAEKEGVINPTEGQLLTLILNKTAPDSNEALQKMLYSHFYQPKPLRAIKADMQAAKVLLNIGIPFIVKEKGQFSICVGYWEDSAGIKFIICGLSEANRVKISKREFKFLRRKTIPFQKNQEDEKVMVEDDLTFSLTNKNALECFRAIAFPENAEMLIVNKPSFNEDILKDFLLKKIEVEDVKN